MTAHITIGERLILITRSGSLGKTEMLTALMQLEGVATKAAVEIIIDALPSLGERIDALCIAQMALTDSIRRCDSAVPRGWRLPRSDYNEPWRRQGKRRGRAR